MSHNDSNGYLRYLARDYPVIQPNTLIDIEEDPHDSDEKSSLIDELNSDEQSLDGETGVQYDSDWSQAE